MFLACYLLDGSSHLVFVDRAISLMSDAVHLRKTGLEYQTVEVCMYVILYAIGRV